MDRASWLYAITFVVAFKPLLFSSWPFVNTPFAARVDMDSVTSLEMEPEVVQPCS